MLLGVGEPITIKRAQIQTFGLADGEQQVALRRIRTKPELTARARAPQRAVGTKEGAWYGANCLPGPREPFKRGTASLALGELKEHTGFLISRSLTLHCYLTGLLV